MSAVPSRTAPPLQLELVADRAACRGIGLLVGAAFGGCAAWIAAHSGFESGVALAGLAALIFLPLAWIAARVARRQSMQGVLTWDGTSWAVGAQPRGAAAEVLVDLGDWLLLRLTMPADGLANSRSSRWLALSRGDHEAAWHACRCAVYCPRPRQPTSGSDAHAGV